MAAGAVVAFVGGVADALDGGCADGAGFAEAAVDGHVVAKRRDAFGETVGSFGTKTEDPIVEDGEYGRVEAIDFGVGELLCEVEGREAGVVEDFVGVGVADAAEELGIGEGALEGVVGGVNL